MKETIIPLCLRPREAAQVLNMSERKLWGLTKPRGPIKCKRVGKLVLYRPRDLQEFIESDDDE